MNCLRSTALLMALLLALAACNNPNKKRAGSQATKPNIIYIYADDLGYGELGCYGQEKIHTPNIDRLAKEGIRFTRHYTGAPVCAPARCMLLTGRHAGHSYIRGNYELGGFADDKEGGQMPLPEGTYTIGHLMQGAGYKTAAIGKWGLGMANTTGDPNRQGFDYFYGYLDQKQAHNYYPTHLWENGRWDTLRNKYFNPHGNRQSPHPPGESFRKFTGREYAPDKMTKKALAFIQENENQPFFLYLPYTIPHVSLQIPYEREAYKMYEGKWDSTAYYGSRGYTPHPQPRAAYAAMITQLDIYVGQIMEQVKELGMDENTIMMFSSDNGPSWAGGAPTDFFDSAGGLRGMKQDLYEGGIRMPFIARWPGTIPAGRESRHLSAQYDMMATLAALAGVEAPENDGISMMPALLGKEGGHHHHFLYFEFPENGGQVAIHTGKWKGVKSNLKENPDAAWELYDLDTDESESRDVAGEHPEIISKLDSLLRREHRPAHVQEWTIVNPLFSR